MARKQYIKLQAATLLDFARSTKNPDLAAVLIEKAAGLAEQVEKVPTPSPRPPDVELT